MNLIILAAGIGSRLYPLTKNKPKSLIRLNDGTTLLERQIKNAINSPIIDKIYIITGYRAEQIDEKIKEFKYQIKIETIYNPFYEVSNNLFSLYCAYDVMKHQDFIISNGDNIYRDNVYTNISNLIGGVFITINHKKKYDSDDMKVIIKDELVQKVSKQIDEVKIDAESVGLAIIKGSKHREIFSKIILSLVRDFSNKDKFWLEIFNSFAQNGFEVKTYKIHKRDWGEIDFHPDIESIQKAILKELF